MKRWGIIGTVLLCLALAGSIACELPDGEVSQQPVEVVRGDLTVTVSGSGYISVTNEKQLAFGSGGKIDKLFVEEGDEVKKGEILATLDTSALELSLIQAQLARDEAEYNLKQLKDVLHSSQDRIKLAEAALKAAERAVAEVQKQLDEAATMAAQAIIHLIDLSSLELSAEVDEIDIPDVEPGQKAIIEVDALPDDLIDGEVVSISELPDIQTGLVVYPVKIKFDVPAGLAVRAGMSATADIIIQERKDVLLVPSRVVRQDEQGNTVVNVVIGKEIEERAVVTGISNGLQTEIISGLNEGETVTG